MSRILLAFIFAAFALPAFAANGVDFDKMCVRNPAAFFHKAKCQDFVQSTVAGILSAPHPQICFPQNYDGRQSLPIVQTYVRNHPELLNNSDVAIVGMALASVYPCRR